jgi:hypothetical protein
VVCLKVWLGLAGWLRGLWDWYALVTRLPGVVVGSQGGERVGEAVCDVGKGEQRKSRHTCRCSGTRGYMNYLSWKLEKGKMG